MATRKEPTSRGSNRFWNYSSLPVVSRAGRVEIDSRAGREKSDSFLPCRSPRDAFSRVAFRRDSVSLTILAGELDAAEFAQMIENHQRRQSDAQAMLYSVHIQ
jgi:hypothetical protein